MNTARQLRKRRLSGRLEASKKPRALSESTDEEYPLSPLPLTPPHGSLSIYEEHPEALPRYSKRAKFVSRVGPPPPKKTGFLDLPNEVRNRIYDLILLGGKIPSRVEFTARKNFSHSAALLRTCKFIQSEASPILYGQTLFKFDRDHHQYGKFWEIVWRNIGYKNIRLFLETIGPVNIGLIRKVDLTLDDATRTLAMDQDSEERRFVNDVDVLEILRLLGKYGKLATLELSMRSRRNIVNGDTHFIHALRRVKVDIVNISKNINGSVNPPLNRLEESLKTSMTRKYPLYPVG